MNESIVEPRMKNGKPYLSAAHVILRARDIAKERGSKKTTQEHLNAARDDLMSRYKGTLVKEATVPAVKTKVVQSDHKCPRCFSVDFKQYTSGEKNCNSCGTNFDVPDEKKKVSEVTDNKDHDKYHGDIFGTHKERHMKMMKNKTPKPFEESKIKRIKRLAGLDGFDGTQNISGTNEDVIAATAKTIVDKNGIKRKVRVNKVNFDSDGNPNTKE